MPAPVDTRYPAHDWRRYRPAVTARVQHWTGCSCCQGSGLQQLGGAMRQWDWAARLFVCDCAAGREMERMVLDDCTWLLNLWNLQQTEQGLLVGSSFQLRSFSSRRMIKKLCSRQAKAASLCS